MRVQRSENARGTYSPKPDIVGWYSRDAAQPYTTEPMIVVAAHRVIHKLEKRVEHWRRAPDGRSKESLPADGNVLRLEAVLFEIDVETIYDGLVLGNG